MGWEHGACAEALSFGKQHLAAGGEGKAERSLPQRASHTPSSPCSFSPGLVLPTPSCGHGGIHGPSPLLPHLHLSGALQEGPSPAEAELS